MAHFLALESFIQAAQSRDICDSHGRPLDETAVRSFVRQQLTPGDWPLIWRLTAAHADVRQEGAAEVATVETPQSSPLRSAATPKSEFEGTPQLEAAICSVMIRLRVASVDRVIREVGRVQVETGRAQVLAGLLALASQVSWYGRNLVAWNEAS